MARVAFVLTDDERQAFQDALGEAMSASPLPLPPDALAALATAGLQPIIPTVAGLLHPTIATGFDQPLEFDPGYHLETMDGSAQAHHRGTTHTRSEQAFAFDATPAVARSVQFLLFLMAGLHHDAQPTPRTTLVAHAARRIATAIAAEHPSAPSHLSSQADS